jgi:hypothetical protein
LGFSSSKLARVDIKTGEVHVGMRGVDLLDGSAEAATDIEKALSIRHIARIQEHAIHGLHGRDVVGSGTGGCFGVLPVAPVHLVFPQLAGLTTVLPFVDQQVKVWKLSHWRNYHPSGSFRVAGPSDRGIDFADVGLTWSAPTRQAQGS